MQILKELRQRLCWLGTRSRFYSELAEELQFHVESRAEELEQSGMVRADALALARREFGSQLKSTEETAGAWQVRWLEDLYSDMLYAGRSFRRNPGFTATAIFCLALGVGANTTIFSITTSFLFSEPSCRDSASLISISEVGNTVSPVSDYKLIRAAHIFDGMAGINVDREVNWSDGEHPRRLYAGIVTDDFFTTLGMPFLQGRGSAPGETNTAVISERVWRGALASDPAILGRKMVLDGRIYTVAGVLPADNRSVAGFGISPDVYLPVAHEDDQVQFFARMPKGMSIPIARSRLQSVFTRVNRIFPKDSWRPTGKTRVTGVTGFDVLDQQIPGAVTAFFAMLMIMAGLVLLIACTNVASLLVARASSRSHELAIRASLGAGRRRIIRHLLAESGLLSILGSLAGLIIDIVSSKWIGKLTLPVPIPVHFVISPDWRLLLYSLGIVFATTLLCGLLPALRAAQRDVNHALKQDEHRTGGVWNLRSVLVAGQLSVSIVLLSAASLFAHNLVRAISTNPGFDMHATVWARMRLVPEKYKDPDQKKQMAVVRLTLERLRALPGVESAAITQVVPLNGNSMIGTRLRTDTSARAIWVEYESNKVGPGYFRTMGIPILRGQTFTEADRKGLQPLVIVNESFARAVFGGIDPVGHTISPELPHEKRRLVVGVAKDSKYFTLTEKERPAIYQPYFGTEEPSHLNFLIRTTGPPSKYVKAVTDVLSGIDSTAAIETKPMSRALGLALLPSRAGAIMLGAMGTLGLMLAAIGLSGVLLYAVSRRTREIGIRVALGATRYNILQLIGRNSLVLVGSGMLAGLVLSFFAMQPLTRFLVPGMSTLDPTTFLAVIGVLGTVAALAIVAPALRALRVDAMTALRYE